MPIRLPSYVYRNRCGIFRFRVVFPRALAQVNRQREVRVSLRTADRAAAIGLARYFSHRVQSLFDSLRAMTDETKTPDVDHFKLWLKAVSESYTLKERLEELENLRSDESYQNRRALAEQAQASQTEAKNLALRAYTKGWLKASELAAQNPRTQPATPSPLLSKAIDEFVRFKTAKGAWTEKTRAENLAALNLFVRIASDRPIADIDRDAMIRYAETLQKLPANLTKLFPALTIEEVIAKAPRPMNTRTFNKNVERFSSLLKWAMSGPKKYDLDRNPAVGLARDERKDAVRRLPFTPEELKALFAGSEFSKRAFQNCYAYWLMPLALYTGARLGELTQLYVTDIVEFEGVACLSISDEEEGRRIKTRNSRRLVPIHSKLEELGFLRYVEGLRSAGIARVFPELRPGRDGFGQVASKWFKRYRQRCGTNRRPQPSTTAGTPAASPLPFFLVPRGSAGYDGGRTGNVLILRYPVAARRDGPVVRRPRLGGLLNFYERPAA